MKNGFVKVAAITPRITVANPKGNAKEIGNSMQEAFEHKAKIIVFPELCMTAYTCSDLFLQPVLIKEAKEGLKHCLEASKGKDALVFIGVPWEKDNHLYNTAAVIQNGKLLGLVPKRNIPNYGEFYEMRHFTAGSAEVEMAEWEGEEVPFGGNLLFACKELPELVVGCEICEDLWVPETPGTGLAGAGATVLVNLSASNETVTKDEYRRSLVSSTSARLISAYIYADAGEGESTQDLVFSGHNLIAENGSILAESERFGTGALYTEIDVDKLITMRRRLNTYGMGEKGCRKVVFSLDMEETKLTRKYGKTPFVPEKEELRNKRCEDILRIQAYGLKKRLEHIGCKCAVLGLSGGLDSTLALLVTVKAYDLLGWDRKEILTVTMPCFGTTDRTYDNACRLAADLGATLKEIRIEEAVNCHFRDIGQDPGKKDVTYENAQARERTQILMDLANQTGGLVVGTGDLSELALGWATYNGDHMSMYAVNAGIPKTLVRHLVNYYAQTCGEERLKTTLLDVLDTPVSPELLPPVDGVISQKTEDLVGPYELHDFYLYYMLRQGFSPEKIYRLAKYTFGGDYAYEVILKWLKTFYRRFFSQQFKRSCLPDGPKVGSVAVSPRGDLRMPSDAVNAAWIQQLEKLKI